MRGFWNGQADERFERPVFLSLCALRNPETKQFDLPGGELTGVFRRRHLLVQVARSDAPDEFAFIRLAWDQCRVAAKVFERALVSVQPELGLACLHVRSMAVEANVRENGPDVALKIHARPVDLHRISRLRRSRREGDGDQKRWRGDFHGTPDATKAGHAR